MNKKGNYGIDSPGIVATLVALGFAMAVASRIVHSGWRWFACGLAGYLLLGAVGMLFYSKVGKLALRERLLDKIPWRGDEKVLDMGCGRGLLTMGAAHRLSSGTVVGVDLWKRGAVSGNRGESVLENARVEGVDGRVEVREGDVRALPFGGGTFEVVVSNFVVHELKNRADRRQMVAEAARVLKPGGHIAIVDFMFTDECVEDLRIAGVQAERIRDGFLSFWISTIFNFGLLKTYHVVGRRPV